MDLKGGHKDGDLEIGHIYGKESECDSFGNCDVVAKGLRTGATILMLMLLGILLILGVAGYGVTITIGDDVSAGSGDPEVPPSRPSKFTFHGGGGFGGGEDPISLAPLLEHQRDSQVTSEEDAILRSVFAEYDENDDGLWAHDDFTNFYSDTMNSEETFAFLDSKTNDGYLDMDELTLFFYAFGDVSMLHTQPIDAFVLDMTEALGGGPEVRPYALALAIYKAVPHGENGISKLEWLDSLIEPEWQNFNGDNNGYIDFDEFESAFFESLTFFEFQECFADDECAEPQAALQVFQDAVFVQPARRRMPWNWADPETIGNGVQDLAQVQWQNIGTETVAVAEAAGDAAVVAGETAVVVGPTVACWGTGVCETVLVGGLIILAAAAVAIKTKEAADQWGITFCYDAQSLVNVLREEEVQEIAVGDVVVGDYVYDGTEFTKVYFMQQFADNEIAKMLEIKYGVPSDEQSIALTPAHLLYREGAPLPVRSDEVQIGDVLWGFTEYSVGDGFNFTVYDISTVRRVPVNPITMSSDMMVSGVKTSVFSYSVENRDSLHDAAAIFRWTSTNIDEAMTQSVVDLYYNTIYKGMMTEEMQQLAMSNGVVLGAMYMAIPVVVGMAVLKAAEMMLPARKTQKQI